jgi:alpha-glucosidase
MWHRSGGVDPGRDGCRIPMPWSGDRPPYGFSRAGAGRPWLDPPADWAALTAAAQADDEASMLSLYRDGLRARRATAALGDGDLRFIPSADDVLAFARGDCFACIVNFGPDPVELPPGSTVLIASNPLEGGALPHDTTVWLSQADGHASSWDGFVRPGHGIG